MKKLITSAGVVALGAMSMQASYYPMATDGAKPWSVSLVLRGFYDSNYTYLPKAQHTFGLLASPSIKIATSLSDQTFFSAGYQYTLQYYANVKAGSDADHTHQFNALLDHQFNENNKASVADNFVIAQEPAILTPSGALLIPIRSNGNNIRNTGKVDWMGQMSPNFGAEVSYNNNFYNYNKDHSFTPNYSDLLDRIEHTADASLRYTLVPETILLGGYRYTETDYLSGNFIARGYTAKARDSRGHDVYVGVDHSMSTTLSAAARVGVQNTEYFKDTLGNKPSKWSPYADASLTYHYRENSSATLGVRHGRNATDVPLINNSLVLDQESTAVYGNVSHAFTGDLTGTLFGQYQNSSFSGVGISSSADDYYQLGAGLSYKFNPWLTGEGGYNFDKLLSDVSGRSYTRHYVYLGFRATY